jgi:ATP-dependent protease HslVU (ClpYQ) peptidase subunit
VVQKIGRRSVTPKRSNWISKFGFLFSILGDNLLISVNPSALVPMYKSIRSLPSLWARNCKQIKGRGIMSVIAALCSTRTGTAWIGSDTMACSGTLRQDSGPKWVIRRPWAVGVAGHLRTINVISESADELLGNLSSPHDFAQRVRDLLRADGYREVKDDEVGPLQFGQMLMLARPDKSWTIGADFSVLELPADRLWAEGSGRDLVLGAAFGLQCTGMKHSDSEIVERALEAAILWDVSCGGIPWCAELS